MTNIELANTLEALAGKHRESAALEQPSLHYWAYDKEKLAGILRGLGGRWKRINGEYDIQFTSDALPGVSIYIPRDKVCRKIVTYDCDPIMSPEEEAEVLA